MQIVPASEGFLSQFAFYGGLSGSLANATNTSLIAPATSQNIHVNTLYLYAATACTLIIKEGTGINIFSVPLAAGEKYTITFPSPGLKLVTSTNGLQVRQDSGGAVNVEILAVGYKAGYT